MNTQDEIDKIVSKFIDPYVATLPEGVQAINEAKAAIEKLILEAQTNAVAWSIGVIDSLHIIQGDSSSDPHYKGIKNTLRDKYKAKTGVDPAPSYPVKATLKAKLGDK